MDRSSRAPVTLEYFPTNKQSRTINSLHPGDILRGGVWMPMVDLPCI